MAQHNLEMIKNSGAERVVFSCAGCYSTFKTDYSQIENYDFEAMHVVELLAELIRDGKLQLPQGSEKKVTYHDPCHLGRDHLGRGVEVYREPREVIRSIPGVQLEEMELKGRWSYCCGGGASVVSAAYPEVTSLMSRKRLLEAQEASSILLTTCPRCIENFRSAARKEDLDISIHDLTCFLVEVMGL
jgi:Fe-S oxidoreductase